MKIGLNYVNTYAGGKEFCLTIPLVQLLDNLSEDDRKELIGFAVASGELLKLICRQIARGHESDSVADVLLDKTTIADMRQALMPLLSDAHAEEMELARQKANKSESAERILRSLVHIKSMQLEAENTYQRSARANQWDREFELAKEMYPEYAASDPATPRT